VTGALGVKLATARQEREHEKNILREAKGTNICSYVYDLMTFATKETMCLSYIGRIVIVDTRFSCSLQKRDDWPINNERMSGKA